VKQLVSQIPWGYIVRIMQKVKDQAARAFYIHQTIAHGWSRAVLVHQIESRLHRRQGKALNNFDRPSIDERALPFEERPEGRSLRAAQVAQYPGVAVRPVQAT
jgi:predicted nuclease of restriction endonuclease-like (RecB) superfamily